MCRATDAALLDEQMAQEQMEAMPNLGTNPFAGGAMPKGLPGLGGGMPSGFGGGLGGFPMRGGTKKNRKKR